MKNLFFILLISMLAFFTVSHANQDGLGNPNNIQTLDSTRVTDNFTIHFETAAGDTNSVSLTDNNNNGTPDYIDWVMETAEDVYKEFITNQKFAVPMYFDNTKSKYDLSVWKIPNNLEGKIVINTADSGDNLNTTETEVSSAPAAISIKNSFSGSEEQIKDSLKIFISYYFFRQIICGYNYKIPDWMQTGMAEYATEIIYPNLNYYINLLSNWYEKPYYPFNGSSSDPYWGFAIPENREKSSVLFFKFIEEWKQIRMDQILDKSRPYDIIMNKGFDILEDVFNEHSSDLHKAIIDYFTANLARTLPIGYSDGENFPEVSASSTFKNYNGILTNLYGLGVEYTKIMPCSKPGDKITIKYQLNTSDPKNNFKGRIFGKRKAEFGGDFSQIDLDPNTSMQEYLFEDSYKFESIYVFYANTDYSTEKDTNNFITYWTGVYYNAQAMKLVHGGRFKQNYSSILTLDTDTSYFLNNLNTYKIKGIDQIALTENGNAVWTENNGSDSLIIFKNNKLFKIYDPMDSYPMRNLFNGGENYVFFGGSSIYYLNLNDLSFHTVYNEGIGSPSYQFDEENIITDGDLCAWLHKRWDNTGLLSSIYFYNGSVKTVFEAYEDVQFFDFNGQYITIYIYDENSGTSKLKVYNWVTGITDETATNVSSFCPTSGNLVAYYKSSSNEIDILKDIPAAPVDIVTIKPPLGNDEWISWMSMDAYGIAWQIVSPDNTYPDYLNPKFGYYNFDSAKVYSFYNSDLIMQNGLEIQGKNMHLDKFDLFVAAVDKNKLQSGADVYRLSLKENVTSIEREKTSNTPQNFQLNQNYPNPFNPTTTIEFSLAQKEFVSLKVYNTLGQEVANLISAEMNAGNHSIKFSTTSNSGKNKFSLSSGVYIYRLKAGDFVQSKKMILLK